MATHLAQRKPKSFDHLTVEAEEDEHHEKETGPEGGQRHHGNSLGVRNKCKSRTCNITVKNMTF